MTVDVLYGDHEGGQRTPSRFVMMPRDDGSWITSVGRHWNVDRPIPGSGHVGHLAALRILRT
jgi:hypothetical protein